MCRGDAVSQSQTLTSELHRLLASSLYNGCWPLLRLERRTAAQDDELLHMAHASRHHWGQVGSPANLARGEWMCARVYATLGRAEPALHHALRCLSLVESGGEGFEDWDHPAALEALARAQFVAGRQADAEHTVRVAREALLAVADADDRALITDDLDALGL